jgi:hemoglobin
MHDITKLQDIDILIRHFYSKLLSDPAINFVFDGLDLEAHFPRVVHFWAFVLLDADGYKTNVFEKHAHLPIRLEQFNIWLGHFTTAVDDLYHGEKAEMAKQRATVLTYTFSSKWEKLKT